MRAAREVRRGLPLLMPEEFEVFTAEIVDAEITELPAEDEPAGDGA